MGSSCKHYKLRLHRLSGTKYKYFDKNERQRTVRIDIHNLDIFIKCTIITHLIESRKPHTKNHSMKLVQTRVLSGLPQSHASHKAVYLYHQYKITPSHCAHEHTQ